MRLCFVGDTQIEIVRERLQEVIGYIENEEVSELKVLKNTDSEMKLALPLLTKNEAATVRTEVSAVSVEEAEQQGDTLDLSGRST